jgi:hypothetical protein
MNNSEEKYTLYQYFQGTWIKKTYDECGIDNSEFGEDHEKFLDRNGFWETGNNYGSEHTEQLTVYHSSCHNKWLIYFCLDHSSIDVIFINDAPSKLMFFKEFLNIFRESKKICDEELSEN